MKSCFIPEQWSEVKPESFCDSASWISETSGAAKSQKNIYVFAWKNGGISFLKMDSVWVIDTSYTGWWTSQTPSLPRSCPCPCRRPDTWTQHPCGLKSAGWRSARRSAAGWHFQKSAAGPECASCSNPSRLWKAGDGLSPTLGTWELAHRADGWLLGGCRGSWS